MLRLAWLSLYGAFAALAVAAVARPASLWIRSQGFSRPALAWDVPYGPVALVLLVAVSALTVALAVGAVRARRGRGLHGVFLVAVAMCIAFRALAPAPARPRDPGPPLLDALRRAADELDARYDQRYVPDAAVLGAALAVAPDCGLRLNFRPLRPHARVLSGSPGPQLEPLPGDEAGTIYVAVSPDRQAAWLTVLSVGGLLRLAGGAPAQIDAHAGTHNLPGRDPLVPLYPGAGD